MSDLLNRMRALAGVDENLNESVFGQMARQFAASAPKSDEERAAQRKEERAKKKAEEAEKKSAAKPADGTKRGRGRPGTEQTNKFREWVQNHPNATRKDAIEFGNSLGWKAVTSNTHFYRNRNKSGPVQEFWLVVNPDNGLVLAEGCSGISPNWIDYEDSTTINAEIFMTETAAEATSRKLFMMGAPSVIMCSTFLQEADDEVDEDESDDDEEDTEDKDDTSKDEDKDEE